MISISRGPNVLLVEYLGHVISENGVSTDPGKIEAMLNWPKPKSVRALRGFLGLTSYYRRFVKGYVVISKSLIGLWKKEGFNWGDEADIAFERVKEAMSRVPTFGLLDFGKPFVLESNA
ncbi:uncharacterized mitochondrial protein AtMg00860-like [Diospyros lotus]|uniref:uncharacterized mitochondrial protein AtMg00860-like n=1 Tax=Diospyros lotus TaxID=55363 RepID=UPI002252B73D|nr:uncharacterized mitochondrial protein AtMg00860-like [Diospyros lotus]